MSRNNRQAIGAMHPILFFVVVYGISLFLALFICNTVYNTLHPEEALAATNDLLPQSENFELTTNATVMR